MRKPTLAAAALASMAALPTLANAGWSDRVSPNTGAAVTGDQLRRVAPLGENYKFPTKADRVQGMAPYQAIANSPYAPSPVAVPASPDQDPAAFNSVMGRNRY